MKWEYKTIGIELAGYFSGRPPRGPEDPRVDNDLSTLGKQGWELVAVLPYSETDRYANLVIAFFKRKKEKKD